MKNDTFERESVGNYSIIGNELSQNRKVSMKTKGVYYTIMTLPDWWNFSLTGLATTLGCGKSTLYTCIKELDKWGYCVSERFRNEKGLYVGTKYKFFRNSLFGLNVCKDEAITTTHPLPSFPHVDNPHVDSGTQYSKLTDRLNKKEDKGFSSSLVVEENSTDKSKGESKELSNLNPQKKETETKLQLISFLESKDRESILELLGEDFSARNYPTQAVFSKFIIHNTKKGNEFPLDTWGSVMLKFFQGEKYLNNVHFDPKDIPTEYTPHIKRFKLDYVAPLVHKGNDWLKDRVL